MTAENNWQLQDPVSAIVFDCDGTLSTIEGIDELAKMNGVSAEVQLLTAEAMGQSGLNPMLYQKRLDLVFPNREQVQELGYQYFANQVPDAKLVIDIFQRLKKEVYIVSAGLYPAIKIFAELLNVPPANIFAVDIQFDEKGQFVDYDRTSPLVYHHGKREIVTQLKAHHPRILHIGDGMNDLVTKDLVTRFVGYGGVFYRENIATQCQHYIKTPSLASLLKLALTPHEYSLLPHSEHEFPNNNQ